MLRLSLSKQIITLIRQAWGPAVDLSGVEVSFSANPEFGDLACNAAMVLAKRVGQPPREIAESLAKEIEQFPEVSRVMIAGPGFINLFLHDHTLHAAARQSVHPPVKIANPRTVLVEYSDPNPFKPLHAGHLYTTLVGDMIARLLEQRGDRVIRLNYGGDVGRHVGIAMWAILHELGGEFPDKLEAAAGEDRAGWMGARYAQGYAAFENDEKVQAQILKCNQRVYQLHRDNDHESSFAQIYWTCRDWSYTYFKLLYSQLEVANFDRFIPESEVTPLAIETVTSQLERGVYRRSKGAIVFVGEPYGLHTRVFINSAGLPTYDAKDVGLLLTKWHDYHFDESIMITANEQTHYMEVMLKSVEQFEPEPVRRSRHLAHGMVKLGGGIKMSSRRGNVVTALDILVAAREAAGEQSGKNDSEATILAAVKYAFAKVRIGGDIAYDPKESIALEGNSGPYLQYAHARARSIIAKAESRSMTELSVHLDAAERSLLAKLAVYGDVVAEAAQALMPHLICTYLYELSQVFNRFYEHNRVVGDDRETVRLILVQDYADILKHGLKLLGMTAPDRM